MVLWNDSGRMTYLCSSSCCELPALCQQKVVVSKAYTKLSVLPCYSEDFLWILETLLNLLCFSVRSCEGQEGKCTFWCILTSTAVSISFASASENGFLEPAPSWPEPLKVQNPKCFSTVHDFWHLNALWSSKAWREQFCPSVCISNHCL